MNTSIEQFSGQIGTARWSAWKIRAMAILVAILANVIILTVARLMNGEFPIVDTGGGYQTTGFAQVIVVTMMAGLAAWGLLALLEQWTSRAKAIWMAISVFLFVISLLGPLGTGVNATSTAVLVCMHVSTAATIIPLIRRSTSTRG